MKEQQRRIIVVVLVALITAVISFVQGQGRHTAPADNASTLQQQQIAPTAPITGPAIDALGKLAVKGRAPKTGYSREQFGGDWASVDSCTMRDKILARDMTDVRFRTEGDCTVMSGNLNDPYTGTTMLFARGPGTSSAIQIDHVVAISDAWQKGAQQLPQAQREQLYNDPLELIAVDGKTNNDKSDGDAATWLPPNKDYRCRYVARQVAIKLKYSLWVTQAEHDAISVILASCPGQQLPIEGQ